MIRYDPRGHVFSSILATRSDHDLCIYILLINKKIIIVFVVEDLSDIFQTITSKYRMRKRRFD